MENIAKKITLTTESNETVDFFVLEETRINGVNYILVTDSDSEDKDGECFILKDLSKLEDTEAVFEFVEDDNEIDYLYGIFSQLMADMDVEIEK